MDRVFKLAGKIKQDNLQLYEDYKKGHHTKEYFQSSLITSELILEDMAFVWDVNLDEYYIDVEF